jgi:hypothetical protein
VRKVSGNTGGVDDIIESELINEGARLQEKRERLPELCQYGAMML